MMEELESIEQNNTWEEVILPSHRKSVGSKWVFKTKYDNNGNVMRRKARLVAQGFTQKFGVDYDEVFAPVVRNESVKLLLSFAGTRHWQVYQYDFKTAFLNGNLSEEIYLRPPPGVTLNGKVYRLRKSLYGLKQAAYVWNKAVHESLLKGGFIQSRFDPCVYIKRLNGKAVYILIHVDDILAVTNSETMLRQSMDEIGRDFELKALGKATEFLGTTINRDNDGNFIISQPQHIERIIREAGQMDAKPSKYPIDTGYYKLDGKELPDNFQYRKLIGMLLYVATHTRPDITASVGILSQRVSKPRDVDYTEVKRIARYLSGTRSLSLKLSEKNSSTQIICYTDSDFAEDRTDRKSRSGSCSFINGGLISWNSQKQSLVAQSSAEAEYVALSDAVKDVLWLRKLSVELGLTEEPSVDVRCDNQAAIKLVENDKFSHRTKHIDIRYHLVKDCQKRGEIKITYQPTESNLADIFTKPLCGIRMERLRTKLGMTET